MYKWMGLYYMMEWRQESIPLYHNLPHPDFGRFIGREAELNLLKKLLAPDSTAWVIMIDGIAGIGKTALALETAYYYLRNYHLLPAPERFSAIVWISARSSILDTDGESSWSPSVRSIDDIYNSILITLGRNSPHYSNIEQEKLDQVIRLLLSQQQTLLIIDGWTLLWTNGYTAFCASCRRRAGPLSPPDTRSTRPT